MHGSIGDVHLFDFCYSGYLIMMFDYVSVTTKSMILTPFRTFLVTYVLSLVSVLYVNFSEYQLRNRFEIHKKLREQENFPPE